MLEKTKIMISNEIKIRCERLINAFENDSASPLTDYSSIYIYNDGNNKRKQVTLARGFTQDGGNLWKVLERYISKNGKYSNFFSNYRDKMGNGSLYQDKEFLETLVKSSKEDQLMKDSQDEIFEEKYWIPAVRYFDIGGFKENLSMAVIFDSYLHSGGMLKFLTNKFPEKKPVDNGNERVWIKSYVDARFNWLSNASKILQNTVYRPKFFLGEIRKDNWEFNCPLVGNDSKIC